MLTFNGVSIESFPHLMIEDILVSPIQLTPLVRQRPVRFGAEYVRMSGGQRTVTVSFALLNPDRYVRSVTMRDIVKWARSAEPGRLCLMDVPGMHLNAVCTSVPSPSMRQWWEDSLKLVFTAYDPYWTSDDEKTVSCGTAFTVRGSAPPLMKITRTLSSAASTAQSWSDGTDTITLSQVPAGNLTIDLDTQTIDVGGTSVMDKYTFGSSFIRPHVGAMTITGTGTVAWRERWE